MNVLVISHLYARPNNSGLAPFIRIQLEWLCKRGARIRVISPVPYSPLIPRLSKRIADTVEENRSIGNYWRSGGVDVFAPRYIKLPGRLDMGFFGPLYWVGIRRQIVQMFKREPFDLIHGQTLVPDGFAAVMLGRELGVPVVTTERGYLARQKTRGRLMRKTLSTVLSGTNRAIFVSEDLRRQAIEIAGPLARSRVVYTGVDHTIFRPQDKLEARRSLGLSKDEKIILHVGSNKAVKGVLPLLESFSCISSQLGNVRLVFAGHGPLDEPIRSRALQLGLNSQVVVTGQLSHEEVARWIASADVVAHPSVNEGLPNAIVEAMACCRPVVATRVGGIPELLKHESTGLLVDAGDFDRLASEIMRLFLDPVFANDVALSGRKFVVQNFSWKKHADEMYSVYGEVVSAYTRRPE